MRQRTVEVGARDPSHAFADSLNRRGGPLPSSRAACALLALAVVAFAKYAQPVLLPVAVAVVLTFLFSPWSGACAVMGCPTRWVPP